MDPDEAYKILKAAMRAAESTNFNITGLAVVAELLAAIENLDEWLSKGGYPPVAWTRR